MTQAHPDSEVIIAGGGPVGLCLALLLARAGVSVQVFEAEPEVSLDLRASTFHSPTMDLLEPYGVTARSPEGCGSPPVVSITWTRNPRRSTSAPAALGSTLPAADFR